MRTTLVVITALALFGLGIALAAPPAAAACVIGDHDGCIIHIYCVRAPCGPCDPSSSCCGPECADP